jgi:3-dehydroquinate synthase
VITIGVELAGRSYPIHIGSGLLREAASRLALARGARAVVVSNPVVAGLHLAALRRSLGDAGVRADTVIVPDGELHKDARR